MPCTKCSNGKWKLGNGPCIYKSEESCQKAYKAYLAKKNKKSKKNKLGAKGYENNTPEKTPTIAS